MSTRKSEIVKIAAGLFAKKGFSGTTVREIAEKAGILSGSLYHHFDSKEAIADEILSGYYAKIVERYRSILATEPNHAKALVEMIRIAFMAMNDEPEAVALIENSGDVLFANPSFANIRRRNDELKQMWLSVVEDGIEQGVFKWTLDAHLTRRFIRDSLSVIGRWWRPRGKYSIEQITNAYVDMICNGILSKSLDNAKITPLSNVRSDATAALKRPRTQGRSSRTKGQRGRE